MGIFVDTTPVAVTVDDGVNTIWIRPKMGYGVEQRVIGEAAKLQQAQRQNGNGASSGQTVEINLGAYNLALLVNNILRWEGPRFGAIPCTPDNIELLDDDDPLVEKVLAEIQARNRDPKAAPSEANGNGHASAALIEGEYSVLARDEEVVSPNSLPSDGGRGSKGSARSSR